MRKVNTIYQDISTGTHQRCTSGISLQRAVKALGLVENGVTGNRELVTVI